jgi:FtsP/CotA-like multicopper oxidase with cupredoxin domain
MMSRRRFLGTAAGLASVSTVSGRVQAASIPEAPSTTTTTKQPPLVPSSGPDYQPVVTLNGWTFPWRMNGDWKDFHLVAEPIVREFAPGMNVHLLGLQWTVAGPDDQGGGRRQGPHLRHQQAAGAHDHTTIDWHGVILPDGMDGTGGLTRPHIPVGKTFVYEFELKESGSFMYHPQFARSYILQV